MYEHMSNTCRKSLKRQFDFSVPELDQMEKFMSENMDKTASEILDVLMKDERLNDKQKVIVSYTLGATIGSENALQDVEKNIAQDIEKNMMQNLEVGNTILQNMKIGQGG